MTINDPIADLLSRIKNAALAGKKSVTVANSKVKESIATTLEKEDYLINVKVSGKNDKKQLSFDLVYDESDKPKINNLERASKLSRREYLGYKKMKPVKFGHGHLILSTPKGIMTDTEAQKEKVGGEVLFKVW